MQNVNEWLTNKNMAKIAIPEIPSGFQSVSDWQKNRPPTVPIPALNPVQPEPSLVSKIGTGIENYAQASAETVNTLVNAILHPIDTLTKGFDLFFNSPDIKAGIEKASTPLPNGNFVTDTANLITGVSQALFSPITSVFKVAENVPGLKQVADLINVPFTATGFAGSFASGKIVDWLPISQETKDIIKAPIQEVGSLAGQIFIGGKIIGKISELYKKGEVITPEIATKITEEAKIEAKMQKPDLFAKTETPTPMSVAEWQAKGKPKAVEAPITPKTAPETTIAPKVENIAPELSTTPKYEPAPKEIISVNDKQFNVSPETYTEFTKLKQEYDKTISDYKKTLAKDISASQREYITKQLKAEGMKFSAEKRRLTGDYTQTELNNIVKKEQSNYLGKKVEVEIAGKNVKGEISSPSKFGRFEVKLENGQTQKFLTKDIKDARTYKDIIKEATKGRKEYVPILVKETKGKYPTIHEGGKIKMVEGKSVKIIDGIETFIHKGTGGWIVSEVSTGRFLGDSVSKEGAIAKAKFNISNVGENKFRKLISENQLKNQNEGQSPKSAPVSSSKVKEIPVKELPKPIEGKTNEQLASRVFERMKAENPKLEGELGYNPIKLKEDAQKAVELIATDKQKAYDIAMGKETSTEITSTALNIAMAEKALQDGNYNLYTKLIKNRSLEQTRRGQEIVAERGSVSDNSTSKYVKELIASRLEALGKKYLSDLKDKLTKTTDKTRGMKIIDREIAKVERQIKIKKLDIKTAFKILDELTCI